MLHKSEKTCFSALNIQLFIRMKQYKKQKHMKTCNSFKCLTFTPLTESVNGVET